VAAHIVAENPHILGAALISGVDLGRAFGTAHHGDAADIDDNVGISAGLHILAGTSTAALAEEAHKNAYQWSLMSYASRLVGRPLLLITSDDGFASGSDALANAVQATGGQGLLRAHFETDHSYSDCRIALQVELINWLRRCD
jgi:hypothetical protein